MIHIANPIYDTVFKYLLEDNRIVKTLLSALLKKDVVEAEVRKHEYTNGTRDKISMFRIDFGAKVRESDGKEHLILIELQKTWLETETLRFRQYLGAQYANPENMRPDDPRGYGIPMVTVYLLGHCVGEIEEPVLYVSHRSCDYEGREVTKGLPDPFVESLVHDSIIVQIPRLHGNVNNRLEKVLSVFDQSRKDKSNHQVMDIDEDAYSGDEEMLRIVHRLLAAASDSKLRQDMNVEDEFFMAIENRDTAIMKRDERIKEQDAQLKEQDAQLKEQDAQLKEQGAQLKEQDAQLKEQDAQLKEQENVIRKSVRMLKQSGFDSHQIAAMTGLTIDEIDSL